MCAKLLQVVASAYVADRPADVEGVLEDLQCLVAPSGLREAHAKVIKALGLAVRVADVAMDVERHAEVRVRLPVVRHRPRVRWSGDAQGGRPPPRWLADVVAESSGLSPPASSRISAERAASALARQFRSVDGTERVRSIIVDDSARFVQAISRLLVSDGFDVVGAAGDRDLDLCHR